MKRFPALRWFWRAYIPLAVLVLLGLLAVPLGPMLELRLDPVRVDQSIESVHREAGMLRFVWSSNKLRMAPSNDVDVFVTTPRDHFPWTLANDLSPIGAPRCSMLMPWSQGQVVGTGQHHQPYCIQVPSMVGEGDRIRVRVVAHYRGLWGLWDLPVTFPPIVDPPEASPSSLSVSTRP